MRRFKFRLETVLRHRETIETLREQEFATAQGVLQVIEARIAELQEEFRQTVAGRTGSRPGERLDTSLELDRERYLQTLSGAIEAQQRRADDVRVVVEERRQMLVLARQAREAVSRLREKDLLAHTALGLKLEQEALDELATLRYVRQSDESRNESVPAKRTTEEAA